MAEKSPHEMTASERAKYYEELAKYHEERKDDDEYWDTVMPSAIKIPAGTPVSTVFTMRIDPKELTRIATAAHESGLNTSEFVRRACLAALEDRDRLKVAERAKVAKAVQKQVKELAEIVSKLT